MDGFIGTQKAMVLNRQGTWCTARDCTELDLKIGARLRQIREFEGLSLKQIGDMFGISYQQFQKYETGANRITVSRLVDFCVAMNVSLQSVLAGVTPRGNIR